MTHLAALMSLMSLIAAMALAGAMTSVTPPTPTHSVTSNPIGRVKGPITSVEPFKNSVIIKTNSGSSVTLRVTKNTKIAINGKIETLSKLFESVAITEKAGGTTDVTAVYIPELGNTAQSITAITMIKPKSGQ